MQNATVGARNLDRIGFDEWAQWTPDCGQMLRKGWQVRAECRTCQVQLHVDLRHVITAKGKDFNLWGKTAKCRNLRCAAGVVDFWACPPGQKVYQKMDGHWLARHPLGYARGR